MIRWGLEDAEFIIADSATEAIADVLGALDEADWPEPVTVCEYASEAQPRVSDDDVGNVIDGLYEQWSEDYRYEDPPSLAEAPSAEVRAQLRLALQAVADSFPVDVLATTGRRLTVNARQWVRENRPEWVKEADRG